VKLGVLLMLALALAACKPRKASDADEIRVAPDTPVVPRDGAGTAVEHTVTFTAPETHYLEVTSVVPTDGAASIEVMMPVWTPGSYLVREYARHIEDLRATDLAGAALAVEKTRKNRWTIATGGAARVAVRFRLYARDLTVRTNFVDQQLVVLSPAATFVVRVGDLDRPHDLRFDNSERWPQIGTALAPHPGGEPRRYLAPNFDTLVDSPIVLGTGTSHDLVVEGVTHRLASFGGVGLWNDERAANDVSSVIEAGLALWRVIPYTRYEFLNVLEDASGGGGLEHKASTLILSSPWTTRKRSDYLRWLGLVSHEFFHTWNGKRLRPIELGPFDYESEVHTESLWMVEGITSYYDDLLVRRAGLSSHKEYLEALAGQIDSLETTPGREVQSLSLSSYDAWIKYYRGDENSANSSISYYTKGAVVGFLLDAEIRARTRDRRSLDDVLRLAYERYAGEHGYTPEQLRAVAEEIAGGSLESFWARYIEGTAPLDYDAALAHFGLRFKPVEEHGHSEENGDDEDAEPAGWIGADVGKDSIIRRIRRGTPAHRAGLNVGDEVIALDDRRVTDLDSMLARFRPGETVELTLSRRGQLTRLRVPLERKPPDRWKLEVAPSDNPRLRVRRNDWLGAER
jgi:predicted metalloprotease with PDZ domain